MKKNILLMVCLFAFLNSINGQNVKFSNFKHSCSYSFDTISGKTIVDTLFFSYRMHSKTKKVDIWELNRVYMKFINLSDTSETTIDIKNVFLQDSVGDIVIKSTFGRYFFYPRNNLCSDKICIRDLKLHEITCAVLAIEYIHYKYPSVYLYNSKYSEEFIEKKEKSLIGKKFFPFLR